MKRKNFIKWIDTFLEEKQIDLYEQFEFTKNNDVHVFDYDYVVREIKLSCESDQKAIKEKLVLLDLVNGDIRKFLRYLARALV